MRIISFIAILFGLFAFGCQERQQHITYHDPYLDSFRDRGVKGMIGLNPLDSPYFDSIFFDNNGNIVRRRMEGYRERRLYDSLFFITRLLQVSDIVDNYVIQYELKRDTLIQRWLKLHHPHWEYNPEDSITLFNEVRYTLNDHGKFIESVDEMRREKSVFIYGHKGELLTVDKYSLDDGKLTFRTSYSYLNDMRLNQISYGYPDESIRRDFFNGDLIDSTVYLDYKVIYQSEVDQLKPK